MRRIGIRNPDGVVMRVDPKPHGILFDAELTLIAAELQLQGYDVFLTGGTQLRARKRKTLDVPVVVPWWRRLLGSFRW